MENFKTIPKSRGWPIIGQSLKAVRDPLAFLENLSSRYEDIVRVRLGTRTFLIVQSPEICRHVLTAGPDRYIKPGAAKEMKKFLGEGLATSNGELWKRQRKLIQPAFHGTELDQFISILNEELDALIEQWDEFHPVSEVNVNDWFLRLTLSNITRTMFGADLGEDLESTAKIVRDLLEIGTKRVTSLIKFPDSFPTKSNRAFRNANKAFDSIVYGLIDTRQAKENKSSNPDVLDLLLRAVDEGTEETMSRQQLRDEVATIFMAGHETTAQTLSWCFYHLAANPGVYKQVRNEALELNGSIINVKNLKKLVTTRQVIEETLRLYPPVWVIARSPVVNDILPGNYQVAQGETLLLNAYGIHRDPRFWKNPSVFDPTHFTPEISRSRPSYTFLGFGGGVRICVGSQFAMMVMSITLSRLVSRYSFETLSGKVPKVVAGVTLRAKEGVNLWVSRA